jgi:hypothetical protein
MQQQDLLNQPALQNYSNQQGNCPPCPPCAGGNLV